MLAELYTSAAADELYDEVVTEREHALQSAALATSVGAPPPLIAAALLHDVGHLIVLDNRPLGEELAGDHRHEEAGASFLSRWFGPAVTEPVRLHVAAKRFLCVAERDYAESLSPASVRSLAVQGGPMTAPEMAAFGDEMHGPDAVRVRVWDDEAKVAGAVVPDFDEYRALLASLVVA